MYALAMQVTTNNKKYDKKGKTNNFLTQLIKLHAFKKDTKWHKHFFCFSIKILPLQSNGINTVKFHVPTFIALIFYSLSKSRHCNVMHVKLTHLLQFGV